MTVDEIPADVQFDVAIRLVGTPQDFEKHHVVQVVLRAPDLTLLGELEVPVEPRAPADSALPGHEINHMVRSRILLPADTEGGYDLAFLLDGEPAHRHLTTISIVIG